MTQNLDNAKKDDLLLVLEQLEADAHGDYHPRVHVLIVDYLLEKYHLVPK